MKIVVCFLNLVGVIFVVLQYCGVIGAKHGGCFENERHALLNLKANLVLEYQTNHLLTSWVDNKSDHNCCAWEGVVCNNQTSHVERLDLGGRLFGLFGGDIDMISLMEFSHLKFLNLSWSRFSKTNIPKFYGSLSNLRFLDLQGSYSGGTIPEDFARLSQLEYLDLSWNELEGKIPDELGNLSRLQHLDLSWNYLVGTIPYQLGSLSNLQELYLENNMEGLEFSIKNNHVGGEWLSNLTLLTHLDLTHVQNLNSSYVWLQMISKLPNIQDMKLSSCDLSDMYLRSLPRSLLNFSSSLEILDLSWNSFSSSKIFEWLFNSTSNLIQLDLSFNAFKGTVPYDFGNIRNTLERLDLSYNELEGETLESFRDMCTLHSLHFDYNNLNEHISKILLKLSGCAKYSLQELSLSGNQITGTFPDLSIFPSLKTIDFSNNRLSGNVPNDEKILPSKLECLIFTSNSLEGRIPKSFGSLCSLRSLHFSDNKFNEDLFVILDNLSVGCAKYSLQELYLDRNQIIGTLSDMSMFSSLQTLVLSENLLNGTILKNSTFPYQLERLYLDANNLEGVITDSHFTNMSKLKYLNLNSNSLSLIFNENWVPNFQLNILGLRTCILGPSFPKWLQNQKNILQLDISDARISDVVPLWFWTKATNIRFMNISQNNLTGEIPNLPIRYFEGCNLILDSNQFEGSVPTFFQSAVELKLSKNKFSEIHLLLCNSTAVDSLQILDLSENQLSRQLPDCWNHLKELYFLDLSRNNLSGEVPYSMGSLLELNVLILRNNSLTGKLPFSLKNCTNLVMLDLGDNSFSGLIPYWLGQKLQMLSIRRNQFYGTLPQSLCNLTNIQLLDVSENNISGQIFKCLKNFSRMSQDVSFVPQIVLTLYDPFGFRHNILYNGYDLIAMLMWKGEERLFKNNKLILRSIDLSSNQLTGDIPEEIGNLIQLVSLNLSNNNFTGEITSKIGKLTSLEFLDLSRNHFTGLIPSSLTQIDRLSLLNVSNNNLSGRIPIGTQLQSFDASSYEGNLNLCGRPLNKKCPGDEEITPQKPERHEESSSEDKKPIYISLALGFITGFWGLWGSLLIIRKWRHTYMLFLNIIVDTTYVFMVLNATKFQRWLRGKVCLSIFNRIVCISVEERLQNK